jgi:acetyltransferase-like isoleucine patch superfamily enzyme
MLNSLLKIASFLLPWPLRRRALNKWFGFEIHPSARIGLAWIFPGKLKMAAGASIGHFTVAIHLDQITMGAGSSIGRGNWITGLSTRRSSRHFRHQDSRIAALEIGECTFITKNHHIDCTNLISIGRFSTIAGYRSQLLTHSIDLLENRQDSSPIHIGEYTFVGTNSVILGGGVLPPYSVLGAKSLLNKPFTIPWKLYGGVPAKMLADISPEAKYFSRKDGFVY